MSANNVRRLPKGFHSLVAEKFRPNKDLLRILAFILFLHVVGWFTIIAIIAPQHISVDSKVFGIGTGLTAYMLGIRHAFDADHIAAIDNTTRKMIRQGKRPHTVGFWFSCGHSSIVFIMALLLALGIHAVAGPVVDENSLLHSITGLIGTVVSGGFLYLIAALNLVVLYEIWTLFKQARRGEQTEEALEQKLSKRGLIGRAMGAVDKPWQMFIVGMLFGLGFDTATEITLLVLTGSGAAAGLPWYAVLCLPVLFAAGMSLMDTIDGSFMNVAYGWATNKPTRRIYYNMVVTGLSVAAALLIGSVELLGLIGERFELHGAFWDMAMGVDLNNLGFVIAGLFAATWGGAFLYWKYGGFDAEQGALAGAVTTPTDSDSN